MPGGEDFERYVANEGISDEERPASSVASPSGEMWHAASVGHGSAVVVDDLDVVPVGVQDERAIVLRHSPDEAAGSCRPRRRAAGEGRLHPA